MLINQTLDEALAEQEGDFDPDSRWAVAWFAQCGFSPGEYGVAEIRSKAKNTSVSRLVEAGFLLVRDERVRPGLKQRATCSKNRKDSGSLSGHETVTDQSGEWRNGTSFGRNDLEVFLTVGREAKERMAAHAMKR